MALKYPVAVLHHLVKLIPLPGSHLVKYREGFDRKVVSVQDVLAPCLLTNEGDYFRDGSILDLQGYILPEEWTDRNIAIQLTSQLVKNNPRSDIGDINGHPLDHIGDA
jgi:hypothetical protein